MSNLINLWYENAMKVELRSNWEYFSARREVEFRDRVHALSENRTEFERFDARSRQEGAKRRSWNRNKINEHVYILFYFFIFLK